MTWKMFFTSSIGKKVIMSVTGLFLCTFLIVHVLGNLQIFKKDHGLSFNTYTVFMTSNPLIVTISYTLYSTILLHAFTGLYLEYSNAKKRPIRYRLKPKLATWASRNMALLGSLIFIYLVIHMGNFWYQYKFGAIPYTRYIINQESGSVVSASQMPLNYQPATKMQELFDPRGNKIVTVKDMYSVVIERFKVWWLVLLYIIGVAAVAFHLYHGFVSAFRTLGVHNNKYVSLIASIGLWVFAIVIPVLFIIIPLYCFTVNF